MRKDILLTLTRRDFLKLTGLAAVASFFGGCDNTGTENSSHTPIPGGVSTLVPPSFDIQDSPTATPVFTATPTLEPTPESTPTLRPQLYPRGSGKFLPLVDEELLESEGIEEPSNLNLEDSIREQSEIVRRILEKGGLVNDIEKVKELYIGELVRKFGALENEVENSLEWEYHLVSEKSWLVIPRDKNTGRFWMPIITSAECGDGTGRKIDPSMATTLNVPGCEGDFFDLELLESAGGLGETRQVIFSDTSGWFVFGEASTNSKKGYVWYDMWKQEEESWTPTNEFKPDEESKVVLRDGVWDGVKGGGEQEIVAWEFDPEGQEWKDVLVENLAKEVGVEFPEQYRSDLERDYGEFSLSLSDGLFGRFGLEQAKLPEGVQEKMFLHAMGRFMMWSRHRDPERYESFFEVADRALVDRKLPPESRDYGDWPEFRDLALKVLETGPAQLNIKEGPLAPVNDAVSVNRLNLSIITKQEFDSVFGNLKARGLNFFNAELPPLLQPGKPPEEKDYFKALLIINGNALHLVSYGIGYDNEQGTMGAPLERLSRGQSFNHFYEGLLRNFEGSVAIAQMRFFDGPDFQGDDWYDFWTEGQILRFKPPGISCWYNVPEDLSQQARQECDNTVRLVFNK